MKDEELTPELITKTVLASTARQIVSKLKKDGITVKTCTYQGHKKHRCGCDIMLELDDFSMKNQLIINPDFYFTSHQCMMTDITARHRGKEVARQVVHICINPTLN